MKLKMFLKKYSEAPLEYDEVASAASDVEDDECLSDAASTYEEAKRCLNEELERVGYEFG